MNAFTPWLTLAMVAVFGAAAQDLPPPPPGPPPAAGEAVRPPRGGADDVLRRRRENLRDLRRNRQEAGLKGGAVKGPLEQLKRENPEEYERLKALYMDDRPAFMEEMRDIVAERPGLLRRVDSVRDERAQRIERECQELSRLYQEAEDENEKERLKAELKQAVEEAFEVRIESSRRRIEHLERQLTRFKERIETLEENREKICEDRLEQLTRPPELRWDAQW